MPQTILAIAAMMAVTLLSFQQQRAIVDMYGEMIDDETEVMATGLALQVKAQVLSQPFDQEVSDDEKVTTADLTVADKFGPGDDTGGRCKLHSNATGSFAECDDVDDFSNAHWEEVPYLLHGDTLYFEARVDVGYVEVDGGAVQRTFGGAATCFKEVLVRVRGKEMMKGLKQAGRTPKIYTVREVVEHPHCSSGGAL